MVKDITISDIVIHAKSKKEVYHVLTVEGGLYLPPIIDANKNYIQNIMRGFKKFCTLKILKLSKLLTLINFFQRNHWLGKRKYRHGLLLAHVQLRQVP